MSENTQALVERVRHALHGGVRMPVYTNDSQKDGLAALGSLTAALERAEREAQGEAEAADFLTEKLQAAEARAQKAEAERDELQHRLDSCRELTGDVLGSERRAEAAEARAQKAEESARKFAAEAFSWQDAAQKAEAELKEESAAKWSARERLQKAEAQRDHYKATLRLGIERLDKLEAVVEAARTVAPILREAVRQSGMNAAASHLLDAALAALDEQEQA